MTLSKRSALGVSLSLIVLYWCYQVATQWSPSPLPAQFSDLALGIVRNKLIVLLVILALLRLEGVGVDDVGVRRGGWPVHLGVGLAIGVAMFVTLNVGLVSILGALMPTAAANGPNIMSFFADPWHLLAWLPIGIFGGGVVEELQRIFVFTRFEKWLGRPGLILGVVLSSASFGLGHMYQGAATALATALSGAVLALVYLRRRSALEPMAAHACSDVLAMLGAMMLAK